MAGAGQQHPASTIIPTRGDANWTLSTYPSWSSPHQSTLPQVPSSSPGSYPATSMGPDVYSKVPISGGSNFSTEAQEMPLQTSMPPSVPLSLISEEQHQQPPMRSPYPYVPSSTAPRQMPMTASPHSSADGTSNVPRYVDDGRPAKAPRSAGHQTVPSSGSIANGEPPSDYRYGSYGQVNSGSGDVLGSHYGPEASAPNASGQRDMYPPPQGWRPATSEHHSPPAPFAGSDARAYSSSYDQYKSRPSEPRIKGEPGQPGQPEPYASGHRGSFDGMNNYSWSNS